MSVPGDLVLSRARLRLPSDLTKRFIPANSLGPLRGRHPSSNRRPLKHPFPSRTSHPS